MHGATGYCGDRRLGFVVVHFSGSISHQRAFLASSTGPDRFSSAPRERIANPSGTDLRRAAITGVIIVMHEANDRRPSERVTP